MESQQMSAGSDPPSDARHLSSQAEPEEKPTFLNKVKAKAKKLKSKIKIHTAGTDTSADSGEHDGDSSEDEGSPLTISAPVPTRTAPTFSSYSPSTPPTRAAPTFAGSDSSDVPGHHDSTNQSKSSIVDSTAATPGSSFGDGLDESVFKSDGPSGLEQAVPTNYNYYNADPDVAGLPSDEGYSQPQEDDLSSLAVKSTPLSTAVGHTERGNEAYSLGGEDHTTSTENRNAAIPDGIVPSLSSSDSENDRVLESMSGNILGTGQMKDGQEDLDLEQKSGGELKSSSVDPKSKSTSHRVSTGDESIAFATHENYAGGYEADGDDSSVAVSQELVKGGKDGVVSTSDKSSLNSEETGLAEKSLGPREHDPIVPESKSAVGEKVGNTCETNPTSSTPAGNQTWTSRAYETLISTKAAAASTFGFNDDSMTPDSTPVSQKLVDSAQQAKNHAVSALRSPNNEEQQKPVTDKLSESVYSLKDAVTSKADLTDQHTQSDAVNPPSASKLTSSDVQSTTHELQEKSLAGSVTETISSLPGLLSSKLGFSPASSPKGNSPTPSVFKESGPALSVRPTPLEQPSRDEGTTTTDVPHPNAPPASPGIFDRVSGIASSLFGGAKKPSTEEAVPVAEK